MFGIHRNFPAGGGGSTADATAEQWDIKNGKTAYIAAGKVTGSGYFPAMMDYGGSSGIYQDSFTRSGNVFTAVFRMQRAAFTGNKRECCMAVYNGSNFNLFIQAFSTDYSTVPDSAGLMSFTVRNTAGTAICDLFADCVDGNAHYVFFTFDGDAGTASLIIDGVSTDEANSGRVAPTTGTLGTSSPALRVGALQSATDQRWWSGLLGPVGYADVNGLTWSDFMQTDGSPKPLDESTWTEWSAQPAFWNENGDMVNNLGSAGAMTKSGTINVAAASSWS